MAKQAAPSKKTAKVAKAAVAGKKAKRTRSRKESYGIYIHKVLKQVHPGEFLMGAGRITGWKRVFSHTHIDSCNTHLLLGCNW